MCITRVRIFLLWHQHQASAASNVHHQRQAVCNSMATAPGSNSSCITAMCITRFSLLVVWHQHQASAASFITAMCITSVRCLATIWQQHQGSAANQTLATVQQTHSAHQPAIVTIATEALNMSHQPLTSTVTLASGPMNLTFTQHQGSRHMASCQDGNYQQLVPNTVQQIQWRASMC
jgi:hypothetical protein